jgi:hypothetical protein
MYTVNIGAGRIVLPELTTEAFDGFIKMNSVEMMIGQESVALIRKNFLDAIKKGDFGLVEVKE